ncbi:hypothetical protein ACQ4PT_013325 [Festuca glaucescens]
MPPRTKRAKTSVAGSSARVEKERVSGWERSKFSKNDHRTLKKFGLLASDGAMQVPGDEAVPNPLESFRNLQILSSLPPLPEGGDVPERVVVTDDSQETSIRDSEPTESEKSAGSSDRISGDDEEPLGLDTPQPANTSTSHTLVLSEDPKVAPEPSDPPHSPQPLKKKSRTSAAGKEVIATGSLLTPLLDDPVMKEMMDIGSRFIGFHDEADSLRKALHLAEKRANELEKKLKASEKAREKAEREAASVGDLRDRLHATENALSEKEEGIAKREAAIIARFKTQSARFSTEKIGEMYTRNQDSEEDALLDTLSVLEMNCTLARDCLKAARIAFERKFPHFFPKTDLPDSLKIGVEGTITLVIASGEKVDWAKVAAVRGLNSDKWTALIKGEKAFSKKIITILDPKSSASASTAQMEVK